MAGNLNGAEQLLAQCNDARNAGMDFPGIWNQIIRKSPLVLGLPIQVMIGQDPQLKVQLVNGQFICFSAGRFSLT